MKCPYREPAALRVGWETALQMDRGGRSQMPLGKVFCDGVPVTVRGYEVAEKRAQFYCEARWHHDFFALDGRKVLFVGLFCFLVQILGEKLWISRII